MFEWEYSELHFLVLLSLLPATEDHIRVIDSLYLTELGLL